MKNSAHAGGRGEGQGGTCLPPHVRASRRGLPSLPPRAHNAPLGCVPFDISPDIFFLDTQVLPRPWPSPLAGPAFEDGSGSRRGERAEQEARCRAAGVAYMYDRAWRAAPGLRSAAHVTAKAKKKVTQPSSAAARLAPGCPSHRGTARCGDGFTYPRRPPKSTL